MRMLFFVKINIYQSKNGKKQVDGLCKTYFIADHDWFWRVTRTFSEHDLKLGPVALPEQLQYIALHPVQLVDACTHHHVLAEDSRAYVVT